MTPTYVIHGYTLTNDPHFFDDEFSITPEISKLIHQFHAQLFSNTNKNLIKEIEQAIKKHPENPQFRNFLAVAYSNSNNYKKANEVVQKTFFDFPNYLFARINAADLALLNQDFETARLFLGNSFELKDLYPDRKGFHTSELLQYSLTVLRYHCALEDLERAERVYEIIESIQSPEDDSSALNEITMLRLKTAGIRYKMEEDLKSKIKIEKRIEPLLSAKSIELVHPEIKVLYQYDIRIPQELLRQILSLPRASLIADLENVIDDGIQRHAEFIDCEESEKYGFVLHALFLLMELEAVESLPKILAFLEYEDKILDIWIGDHKTETIWQCIYKLGFSKTDELKQFLIKPGVDCFSKLAVSEALSQICLHHVERRAEIQNIYSEVFQLFIEAEEDDNIIDSEFLGFCIYHLLDCQFVDLLPQIKVLFETFYIPAGIAGNYEKIAKEMGKPNARQEGKELLSIYQLYDHVLRYWSGYNPQTNDQTAFYSKPTAILPEIVTPSVGRNDACPCGSGKKYKKCCL